MNPAKKLPALWLVAVFALLGAGRLISVEPADEVLTNASDVLLLSATQASRSINISITGVVTAAEPGWDGRFFVQDSSGGVFVDNNKGVQPSPGDLVAVSGVSVPGGYAPCINSPHWKKLGTAPLPKAKVVTIEQFRSGTEDSQRVEISGIVRTAYTNTDRLGVELVSGAYRFRAFSPIPPGIDLQTLVGAQVRVRGTAAVSFNAPLRHFLTIIIYAPLVTDFIIEAPATLDPFEGGLTPLNGIAQYRNRHSAGNRIHVKGILTYRRLGEDLFLQDATGGLQVKSTQITSFLPGDVIEAVGFPDVENFLPVLEDAVLRKASEARTNVMPMSVTVGELQQGLHHASIVTLQGKLLDHLVRGVKSPADGLNSTKTTLVLQTTNLVFTAEKEAAGEDAFLRSIPIGSTVEVSGICLLQSTEDGKIKSVQFLLPASKSVRVLAKPSWLTPQHLSIILAVALVVIIVASSWIIMVSKRNSALGQLIHQRELDQIELQKAHDTLEWRVKERTKQLEFQITVRKEAEVQFESVLAERTRLAQELHDTLEQTLTGITLQLNTVAKLFQQEPGIASHHLGLARNMIRTSRVDLRRSIWNLRSRELEEFDLSRALLISGNLIADGVGIRVEVETKGPVRPLPEIVEENILRIGQEAITNTVKHSGADQVIVKLEFNTENVILEIKDNGNGFTPGNCVGPNDGHFGLLGMSERAKRVGGQILITSAPGRGTVICVQVPIEQPQITQLVSEQTDYEEGITDPDSCC